MPINKIKVNLETISAEAAIREMTTLQEKLPDPFIDVEINIMCQNKKTPQPNESSLECEKLNKLPKINITFEGIEFKFPVLDVNEIVEKLNQSSMSRNSEKS